MTSTRKKAYIALIINVIVWGAAFPIVKLALPYTTPFHWLFYRYLFAAPLALPFLIYYIAYRFKPTLAQIAQIASLELIGAVAVFALLYEGLKRTSALDASLIMATRPIFVVLNGIFILSEREEKREWIGLLFAFFGTILITIEPIFNGASNGSHSSIAGNVLIIIGNIVWAGYLVLAKRTYRKIPKPFVTAISLWVALFSFALLSFVSTPNLMFADLAHFSVLTAALYMAIFGSIIGATTYLYGQNLIEISEATLFTYLQPAVSIPLAMYLLGDKLRPTTVVGILIIAVGVYLAERRPHRV